MDEKPIRLTGDDVRALLEAFEASTWQEMTVEVHGDRLYVSRRPDGSSHRPPPTPAPPATHEEVAAGEPIPSAMPVRADEASTARSVDEADGPSGGIPVNAPSVGLFWRAPAPGAPPFIDVGSRIKADDTIAIIEVMKLMSPLVAGVSGVVTAILVENGATVTRGQALVLVDVDG